MVVDVVDIREEYIEGFREALDSVAREKRFLTWTEAPSMESARAFVRSNIQKGAPQVVAVETGKVVGWCDISPHERPTTCHCGTLGIGVVSSHRHQGVGESLIRAALSRAKRRGLERVELEVFDSNTPAIALYRKIGFATEGKKIGNVKIDGVNVDTLQMALFLKDYAG